MAYSKKLAARVRKELSHLDDVTEKKMFSGITFMVNGKMCISVGPARIMCRINPLMHEEAIKRTGSATVLMKGREYKGYLFVSEDTIEKKAELNYWVKLCLDYNIIAKASKKKKVI
jgi:TfoX/Sxy family transcriptional regulator of competence genes